MQGVELVSCVSLHNTANRQLLRCWGVDLANNDLAGIVGEPTHLDRVVRSELISLTEKVIDMLTRVIPYILA